MKKIFCKTILFIVIGLFITGCSAKNIDYSELLPNPGSQPVQSSPASSGNPSARNRISKKITIGVSMQGLEAPYVARVKDYIEKTLQNVGPEVEAFILDGQENAEKQVSHMENFISRKMDAIILNPISYDKCVPAVDTVIKAGIPIITLITLVSNQKLCNSFVGSDHFESGVIEADMLVKKLNGKGNIVVLEGVMGIDSQIKRMEGYKQVLARYPEIKIIEQQTASWKRSEAYAIVQNWIENKKDFVAVLSENDNMAMGAVKAIEEAGRMGQILVFGIDGDEDALQAVADGRLEGTVFQDAEAQARQAVYCAIDLAKNKEVHKEYVIPFKPVTKDNIKDYLK